MNQHVARHWRETPQRYRLEAGKCIQCNSIHFPPRLICPRCKGQSFVPINLKGKGKLITYTIIRIAPMGFEDLVPYGIGIIELEEGVLIMGQITDCNPETLKIGDPLIAKFRRVNEEGKTGMIQYGFKFVPDLGL